MIIFSWVNSLRINWQYSIHFTILNKENQLGKVLPCPSTKEMMLLPVTLLENPNMLALEERVDSLEARFGRFIINSDNTLCRLENLMIDMRQQADRV
jgi:hypothetical protein